jgi:hypothetical protein
MVATPTAEAAAPCWKSYATGLVLAAMCTVTVLGFRACRRRWSDGRRLAAATTGALVVVWVLAGLGAIGAGLQAGR